MNYKKELPRYRCLNTVWALKIKFINPQNNNILVEEEGYEPIEVDRTYFAVHQPHVGGYLIIDKYGVKSFQSSDDFEEQYAPL